MVTRILARDVQYFHLCTLGLPTPDLKYKGEDTELRIGKNNTIREQVTINPGTVQDKGITQIGDNNLFMVGCAYRA